MPNYKLKKYFGFKQIRLSPRTLLLPYKPSYDYLDFVVQHCASSGYSPDHSHIMLAYLQPSGINAIIRVSPRNIPILLANYPGISEKVGEKLFYDGIIMLTQMAKILVDDNVVNRIELFIDVSPSEFSDYRAKKLIEKLHLDKFGFKNVTITINTNKSCLYLNNEHTLETIVFDDDGVLRIGSVSQLSYVS